MSKAPNKSLLIAACISAVLFLVKGFVYLLTSSNLVLGSCLDSFTDTVMSFVNYRVQGLARERPDKEHPFGHGGFEVLSAMLQGALLSGLGVFMVFESVQAMLMDKMIRITDQNMPIAIAVLSAAALSGLLIHRFLEKHNDSEESLSAEADKAHYLGDFWQNIFAVAGVIAVWVTGFRWLDGVFGICVGLVFLKVAYPIIKTCINDVSSHRIEGPLKKEVLDIAQKVDSRIGGIHRFRSRRLGPNTFIDFHMKMPDDISLKEAHDLGDKVVGAVKKQIRHLDVIIHLDPQSEPDDDLW